MLQHSLTHLAESSENMPGEEENTMSRPQRSIARRINRASPSW